MHICFITSEFPKPGFPHGGVGTFVATLGEALVEKGIQVSVIGLNYVPKEETETEGMAWHEKQKYFQNKWKKEEEDKKAEQ